MASLLAWPEVGEAHQRYEFAQKVAITTTNCSNWIVGAKLPPNNPHGGHTLSEKTQTIERVTGMTPSDVYVNKGYRGHGSTGPTKVHVAGQAFTNLTRAQRLRRRRRSAIEPIVGHLKSDHRMNRCFLAGIAGDAINAALAAAGSNLRKLLRRFAAVLIACCEGLVEQNSTKLFRCGQPTLTNNNLIAI